MKEFLLSLGFTIDECNWYNLTTKDYNIEIALGSLPFIRVEIGDFSIYYVRIKDVTSIDEIKLHLANATRYATEQLAAMNSAITVLNSINEKLK